MTIAMADFFPPSPFILIAVDAGQDKGHGLSTFAVAVAVFTLTWPGLAGPVGRICKSRVIIP